MKAALYGRVSTTNGQDPEMQLREPREYCDRRGWEVIGADPIQLTTARSLILFLLPAIRPELFAYRPQLC